MTCTQSPTQPFTYVLTTGAGVKTLRLWAMDATGNISAASQSVTVTFSQVIPQIAITGPSNTNPVQGSITLTGNCDITAGDVDITGNITRTLPVVTTCAGGIFSQVVTFSTGDGTKNVDVAQTNQFGTTGSDTRTFTKDTTSPSVTLTSTASNPTNTEPFTVTASFSKPVTGFTSSSVVIGDGTISGFTGSGSTYSFHVTPTSVGTVTVDVPAGAAQDVAGNPSTAASTFSLVYDNVPATVTLTSTAPSPTNLSSIPVSVTFSKSVTGFTAAGLSLVNATATGLTGSGSSYSFNLIPSAQGTVSVLVVAAAAHDTAGNANTASSTLTRVYNSVQPSVTLATSTTSPTRSASVPVTVTFSEAVTGFSSSSMTLVNATASGFAGSGSSYSFNLVPSGQGTFSAKIAAGVASDTATNTNTASNTLNFTYDSVAPTVVITSTMSSPTNASSIPVTVTFSETVTGLSLSGINVTNGTASSLTGSGTTYAFNVAPSAQGSVNISINSSAAQDAAGNQSVVSNTLSLVYDSVQPTVTLTTTANSNTNLSSIPITATFSKAVTGLTLSGITVTNGTASSLAGSGTTYTFSVAPSAQGAVTIQIPASSATDSAGNTNLVSNTLTLTYDSIAPTVTLTSTASDPTNVSPIAVTATFSEAVTGLTLSDFTVSNGTAGSLSGSGTTYTFSVTPTANGSVSVTLPANSAQDTATNGNTVSNTLTRTFSTTQPTVTVASTLTSPTNQSPIPVTVTFSTNVTGFTSSSVTLGNGTLSGFAGSGSSYSFNVTPSAQGAVTVSVAAGVAQDSASNQNLASNSLSVVYNTVAPTATLTSTSGSATNVSPIPVTLTFSESVTGFTLSGLTVTNGTASALTGSGASYAFNVTPSGQGAVTVIANASSAHDAAGNQNTVSNTLTRTYDTVAPTVTISTTATSPTNAASIAVTATFSEAVTGFALGSISVSNGSAVALSGMGTTYTFNIVPSSQGAVSFQVLAAAAQDAATNPSTASNILSLTYDTTQPTVILSTTSGNPTNVSPIPITATFSKSVTGLAISGLTITNGTASALSGSGTTYTFSVTPSGQGAVTAQIQAAAAQDAATNQNTASNTLSVTYDTVAPVLTVTAPTAGSYINLANQTSLTVTGTCTKTGNVVIAVSGVTSTVACTSNAFSTSLDVHTLADGSYNLTANMTDAAGNNATQISVALTKDTTTPTVNFSRHAFITK